MLNIVDYIDSDEEGTSKSTPESQKKNAQPQVRNLYFISEKTGR